MQYPITLKNNIYQSNKLEPLLFSHSDTNPVLDYVLVHSVDKTQVLVVTVGLIWLLFVNILFFHFVLTPNKPLRFTRFRKSSVNSSAVVLTIHCQSYTTFLLDVHCLKWWHSFLISCLYPVIMHLRNLFCWAHLFLECC